MSTVIQVDDVWKKYRLGVIGTGTLRHDFERWWHRLRGKPDPHAKVDERGKIESEKRKIDESQNRASDCELGDDEVWALRSISFEVKQGEILGIIGRNGAGKSTLLKILSRVTSPTKGEIRIKGRIASLLEVGTGFHPELTGRENVFLNGAILGMTKPEIRSKLDEIVAFAEIDQFLDTPVKRYSSGMYVRLAFAVAAHLEPEILIVDEVLAVGDADFQRKCLGKMGSISQKEGRTILFVSHNMGAVTQLCCRVALLSAGRITKFGGVADSVETYLDQGTLGATFERPWHSGDVTIVSGQVRVDLEAMTANVGVWLKANKPRNVGLDMHLTDRAGSPVAFGSLGTLRRDELVKLDVGATMLQFSFPVRYLANGVYAISLDVTIPFKGYLDRAERCLSFEIAKTGAHGMVMAQQWGYGSIELPLMVIRNEVATA
jgi:lipopolysaccharide transport system ATP-binding protein